MSDNFTPGPWSVTVRSQFPFDIAIAGVEPIVTLNRWAYSSEAKTVEDVMLGIGFPHKQRPEVTAANSRQMANAFLIAAAPDLYDALVGLLRDLGGYDETGDDCRHARSALAKARGEQP